METFQLDVSRLFCMKILKKENFEKWKSRKQKSIMTGFMPFSK